MHHFCERVGFVKVGDDAAIALPVVGRGRPELSDHLWGLHASMSSLDLNVVHRIRASHYRRGDDRGWWL